MSNDDRTSGLGDDQGTRVGAPNPGRAGEEPIDADATDDKAERAKQAPNAGRTRGGTEEDSTGAGSEAAEGIHTGGEHDREHRSGYGGAGGKPVRSSDDRQDL